MPQRVVSLNLCTDQMLMLLAEPQTIIGLSPLARNCVDSVLCKQAAAFPTVKPLGEAVLTLRPDLVLGGTYTALSAMTVARAEGLHVETFDTPDRLSDIPTQIRRMAALLGVPERGEKLAEAFTARLNAVSSPVDAKSPTAAFYGANGYVVSSGSLPDDVLAHAGFRNFAATLAPGHSPYLSVERIVAGQPDLLIEAQPQDGRSLAQSMLDHPALRQGFPQGRRLALPSALLLCGLPQTLDAVATLRHLRDRWAERGK